MDLLQFLPNCITCLEKCDEFKIVCGNGHFLCHQCLNRFLENKHSQCPICRETIVTVPCKWSMELLEKIKYSLLQKLGHRVDDKIDFYDNDDQWKHGKISSIHFIRASYVIDSDEYTKDEILIPFSQEHRITKEFQQTEQWRNFSFLSLRNSLMGFVCEQCEYNRVKEIDFMEEQECFHEGDWQLGRIVYQCELSNTILLVFIHSIYKEAYSRWFPLSSKKIKLI